MAWWMPFFFWWCARQACHGSMAVSHCLLLDFRSKFIFTSGQHIPLQTAVGHHNIDGIDHAKQRQRDADNVKRPVESFRDARIGGAAQIQEKRNADKQRRDGGHRIVDRKLQTQRPVHFPLVHAKLLKQQELPPVPVRLGKLLDGQDCGSGHGENESQIIKGKDCHCRPTCIFFPYLRCGIERGIACSTEILIVTDPAQRIMLPGADRLLRHGGIQIMADRTGENGFIRQDEDKIRTVGIPELLVQIFRVNTARTEHSAVDGDRLCTGCHDALLIRNAVDQIFAGCHGNGRVSQHGAQGGVIAELHPSIIGIAGMIVRICVQIVRDMGVRTLVDTVRMGGSDRDRGLDIGNIVTEVLIRAVRTDENIVTGLCRPAAFEDGAEDQAGALRDQHGGEQQRDRGHDDSHGI